jgi:hypothetical protein
VISAHTITATSGSTELDVKAARVTMDLGWAPYVQAELTCALPAADVLARLDPRKPTRVRLEVSQRFTGSTSVARISEAWSSPEYDYFQLQGDMLGWLRLNPQAIVQANEHGLHILANSPAQGLKATATKTFATIVGEQYVARANVHAVGYRPDTSAGIWTSADGQDVTVPLPPIPAGSLFYDGPSTVIEHPFTAISTQTEIQVWGLRDTPEDWWGGEMGMEWFVLQFGRTPDFSPVPVTNIVTNTSFENDVSAWTGSTATGVATLARAAGGVVGSWAARLTWTASPNLLANPSFETNTSYWNGVRTALTRVASATAKAGGYVAHLVNDGTANTHYLGATTAGRAAVTAGQVVTLSTYARLVSGSGLGYTARLYFYDAGGVAVGVSIPGTPVDIGPDWSRLFVTTTVPVGAVAAATVVGSKSEINSDTWEADDLVLELGSAPSAPSGSLTHTFELGGGGNDYVYSASVWVRSSVAQTVALRLTSISTPTGGSIDLVTAQGPPVALAAGVWTELRYDTFDPAPPTAPPYAYKIRMAVEVDPSGTTYAVGDHLEADAAIVTRSRSAPEFFDGDTPDDLGDRYSWTGNYRASASLHDFPANAPISGVSTHYAGKTIAAISADFAMPWNPGPIRPGITRTFDLGVRTRTADVGAGELRLSLASDEAMLQDYAFMSKALINVGGTSLAAAVNYALAQIGATLADAVDAVIDPAALDWTPGTSGWDFCAPLVQAGARRLWCDGARKWHLADPVQPTSGGIVLEPIQVTQVDTVDRDSEWADGVVIEYAWDDTNGLAHLAYDVAGSATSTRVKTLRYERQMAATGAAATILARSQDRGRGLAVSAVADYSAAPGLSVTMPVADGTTVVGMVESVSFAFPDDEMEVAIQDVSRAALNSWAAIPAGIPWSAIPVGMSWSALSFPQGG